MTASKFLGGLLLFTGVTVISTLINGFTLATLWGWFIVPTFGLPSLGLAAAIGLAMVVSFLTYQYIKQEEETDFVLSMIKVLVFAVFRAIPTLGIGYIVHLFM